MSELGGYGPTIIATMWTQTAIALVFVGMRLWTRMRINQTVGWDDYLICLTWFMLMPYTVAVSVAALKGFGRHSSELTVDQFVDATRAEIIGQTFCIIGIATSKASVAVFLLRITVISWHQWVLYSVMVCVSIPCFFCAIFDFVRCQPVEHVWNPNLPGTCWISNEGFTALSITVGGFSAAADFVLAILPWFILWGLQMKKKDKILVASSMSLGIFAGICGVIRAIALRSLTARSDYSYETVGLILWSSTELTVTILTATIPTLRPFYKQILSRSSSISKDRRRSYRLQDVSPNNEPLDLGPHVIRTSIIVAERQNDDQSDKSILGRRRDGNIICTEAIEVKIEEVTESKCIGKWAKMDSGILDMV